MSRLNSSQETAKLLPPAFWQNPIKFISLNTETKWDDYLTEENIPSLYFSTIINLIPYEIFETEAASPKLELARLCRDLLEYFLGHLEPEQFGEDPIATSLIQQIQSHPNCQAAHRDVVLSFNSKDRRENYVTEREKLEALQKPLEKINKEAKEEIERVWLGDFFFRNYVDQDGKPQPIRIRSAKFQRGLNYQALLKSFKGYTESRFQFQDPVHSYLRMHGLSIEEIDQFELLRALSPELRALDNDIRTKVSKELYDTMHRNMSLSIGDVIVGYQDTAELAGIDQKVVARALLPLIKTPKDLLRIGGLADLCAQDPMPLTDQIFLHHCYWFIVEPLCTNDADRVAAAVLLNQTEWAETLLKKHPVSLSTPVFGMNGHPEMLSLGSFLSVRSFAL